MARHQIFRIAGRERKGKELGHLVWMQLGERELQGLESRRACLQKDDRLLLVFPEGARGTQKLFWNRYSLGPFGTGFLRLCLALELFVLLEVVAVDCAAGVSELDEPAGDFASLTTV